MAQPDRVVGIEPGNSNQFSYLNYRDLRDRGLFADVAGYRQTVLTAFQQVEDSLAAERILSEQTEKQKQAVGSAQQFFDLEYDRYQTGIDPYIDVLTAQNTLLGDQQALGVPAETLADHATRNARTLFGMRDAKGFFKDAFHEYVIRGDTGAINPAHSGTKSAAHYKLAIRPGASVSVRLRLAKESLVTAPFTVRFVVTDDCGDWNTLIGAGSKSTAAGANAPMDIPVVTP